jgi:peroxiredoxin
MKILKNTLKILAFSVIVIGAISCQETKEKTTTSEDEKTIAKAAELLQMQVRDGKVITGYGIGDEATDFKLKDVTGALMSMADYKDAKGFIVIFTCNTCPYAVASEGRIVALDVTYKSKGYPVIAVNPNDPKVQPDDTYALMQAKAKDAGFTFPYLYDANDKVYATYGAKKTPHVYLLQKDASGAKLIVKYIGAIDDNVRNGAAVKETFLSNAIDALLDGREIEKKETKAIGCSIKV